MARDTYSHLLRWLGESQPDYWDQIRELVDQFNRATTPAGKKRALQQLCE